MLKKFILTIATMIATMSFALAQVDVNKADQAALDGIKGIGPKTSQSILDERKKGGPFKDWADLQKRVKGIGDKSSDKLSEGGLTVNGQSKTNATAAAKDDKKAAVKPEAEKDSKAKDAKKDNAKK